MEKANPPVRDGNFEQWLALIVRASVLFASQTKATMKHKKNS